MNEAEQNLAIEGLEISFLPKIELFIKDRSPIELERQDIDILKSALLEAGLNLDLREAEARESLIKGTQLRVKPQLADGEPVATLIYDRSAPEGQEWKEFDEDQLPPLEFFKAINPDTGQEEIEDRSYGVMRILSPLRFEELLAMCYEWAAEKEFPGRIKVKKEVEGKKIVEKPEETRGRGLQQAAADILAIATLDSESPSFDGDLKELLDRLNKRFYKGLRKSASGEEQKAAIDAKFSQKGFEKPSKLTASFPPNVLPKLIRFLAGGE